MVAVLALLSSVLWGTSDFLGGTLARRKPVLAIVGFGQLFGLGAMVLVATATGSWGAPLGYLPWAVLAAASGLLGLFAFYTALALGQMGEVSPIAATGIVVPLVGGLLVGDLPNAIQGVGVLVAIVGLFLVVAPEKAIEDADGIGSDITVQNRRRSIALAFLAALMFGTSLAAIAQGSLVSPIMTMTSMRMLSVVVLLGIAIVVRSTGEMSSRDICAAGVIGLLDVGANLTYGLAASSGELVIAAVLGSLYPVATVLLAWRFQGERLRQVQYAGVGLALAGVVLMSIR